MNTEQTRSALNTESTGQPVPGRQHTITKSEGDFVITDVDENDLEFVTRGRASKYNFDALEPGQGFKFPVEMLKAVQAAASNYAVRHKDYAFTVRMLKAGDKGVVIRKKAA